MKKVVVIFMLIILSLGSVGCSNSTETKAIEQGKLSLANLEYDKALGSFELAISEGTKDEEVKTIVKIIEDFKESKRLIDEGKMEEGKKVLNEISEEYKNYTIKDDVNSLKEKMVIYYKGNEVIEEKLNIIDSLLGEGKYSDSKVITDEILSNKEALSEAHKAKIDAQLRIIEDELAKSENIKAKLAKYRQKYPGGEDPNYTWSEAIRIITKVKGAEDGTFIYNGRTDVKMDDKGRRFYTIWKEDPNAESTADGTISTYNVFDDGTVNSY